MDDLELFDLYNKTSDKKKENFKNKVNSTLHITSNYNKVECNYEWLDICIFHNIKPFEATTSFVIICYDA